jgi:hypothetical protein
MRVGARVTIVSDTQLDNDRVEAVMRRTEKECAKRIPRAAIRQSRRSALDRTGHGCC